jgi:hypothetical protein
MPREDLTEIGVESPRWYVPRLVVHAKWAGQAQREQPKVTRGRGCVSQKVGGGRSGWLSANRVVIHGLLGFAIIGLTEIWSARSKVCSCLAHR